MKFSTWSLVAFAAACLVVVGLVAYFSNRDNVVPVAVNTSTTKEDASSAVPVAPNTNSTRIGGVNRPAKDFAASNADDSFEEPSYGLTPAVAADANPQVAAVAKAIQEKNRPELFSPVIAPNKFDPEAYAQSPQDYLDSPEPGRVFVPAQPGEGVREIQRVGDYYRPVIQGESVKLVVAATPKVPVTFTSFDLGLFSNQLTTITVAVDDQGVAVAEYFATPGTIDEVNILAASPVTSGQVKFLVDIDLPVSAEN